MPSRYRGRITNIIKEGDFDLILVHSMPNIMCVAANRYTDVPVAFDERDMVSAFQRSQVLRNYIPERYLKYSLLASLADHTVYRKLVSMEREANLTSDVRMYVSNHTYELARSKYDIPVKNSLVFPNYAMRSDIKEPRKKLSESGGEIHMVYEGVLSLEGYRAPILKLFQEIARSGIHIHIYGIGSPDVLSKYREFQDNSRYYHVHDGVPHDILMNELTEYDYGLIPFIPPNSERDHFDTMLPNKMFDYLAAGLPVIVPDSISMSLFVREHNCGLIFGDIKDLPSQIETSSHVINREDFIIETHIDTLLSAFRDVIR